MQEHCTAKEEIREFSKLIYCYDTKKVQLQRYVVGA